MNDRKGGELIPATPGRYELNLAEYPLVLLGKGKPGDEANVIREEVRDSATGRVAVREVRIQPSNFGYPTEGDGDILLGLVSLSRGGGNFAEKTVTFTRQQLLRVMGWTRSQKAYDRIQLGLDRWQTTRLVFDGSWYDNHTKRYINTKLVLIQKLHERGPDSDFPHPRLTVTWSDDFARSLSSGYIRSVDLEMYRSLAAVDQHRDARGMGPLDHLGDWDHRAGDVRHMRHRDHLGPR